MKKNKGFTLIELLVVIAIIGILSSVVLASLNSARQKGQDAAIKQNLNNMRAQTEMYFDNNDYSYGDAGYEEGVAGEGKTNICNSADGMREGYNKAVGIANDNGYCVVNTDGESWVAWVQLKTKVENTDMAWCVDSSGLSEEVPWATYSSQTSCLSLRSAS